MLTGKEVRDLGYVAWKDPWAWMETMKGKRWENLIHKEKTHYNDLLSQPHVEKLTKQMEKEIQDALQYLVMEPFKIGGGTIDVFLLPTSRFTWKWSWKKKGTPAYDLDVQGNIVWYLSLIHI